MAETTNRLEAVSAGDSHAAAALFTSVYDELRRLAAQHMAGEPRDHTLNATALVHEAYLRLIGAADRPSFAGRGHFFAAAAEAMRRILIDHARHKLSAKAGGRHIRSILHEAISITTTTPEELLAVDDALARLADEDASAAELVKLRYYGGLSIEEAAEALGLARATAYRHWSYARAWLRAALVENSSSV